MYVGACTWSKSQLKRIDNGACLIFRKYSFFLMNYEVLVVLLYLRRKRRRVFWRSKVWREKVITLINLTNKRYKKCIQLKSNRLARNSLSARDLQGGERENRKDLRNTIAGLLWISYNDLVEVQNDTRHSKVNLTGWKGPLKS